VRAFLPEVVQQGRDTAGIFRSTPQNGANGRFVLVCPATGRMLLVLASSGADWTRCGLPGEPWEHVSVSILGRTHQTPAWPEMDFVRGLFWNDDETVIQFHPPRAEHINFHQGCLHLWKPPYEVPLPPPQTIGPKEEPS
jgi:hypothetical protein